MMKKGFQKGRDCAGNVLFMILIAVVLFAALSYAVTQSNRGTGRSPKDEKQKILEAEFNQYQASINWAVDILRLGRRCENVYYTPPKDHAIDPIPDKSCHVFYPQGGGVAWRSFDCPAERKVNLQVGESCNGIIYAGVSGGNRIYALALDYGYFRWVQDSTIPTVLTSNNDGLNNTNTILALPDGLTKYPAAAACRSLGEDWYLPSRMELQILYNTRNTGDFAGTYNTSEVSTINPLFGASLYWSSSSNADIVWIIWFFSGDTLGVSKSYLAPVRCVRR